MSQLIVRIYKLSHTTLRTNARGQVRSPSHLFTGKSEQNITTIQPFSLHGIHTRRWRDIFVLFVTQCTLVKSGPVHSGWMQCILVNSDEFENSYSLLYFLLKSWLSCCSLATLAPHQLIMQCLQVVCHEISHDSLVFSQCEHENVA